MTAKYRRPDAHIGNQGDYERMRRLPQRLDVRAKEQRLKRMFGNRQLKGNSVLESRR
jgi:hypothetical protein